LTAFTIYFAYFHHKQKSVVATHELWQSRWLSGWLPWGIRRCLTPRES